MLHFLFRILLVSTFFIGLGAIADRVSKSLIPTKDECVTEQKAECEATKIRVIKIENASREQFQYRMILPNINEFSKNEVHFYKPINNKKILVFRQDLEKID